MNHALILCRSVTQAQRVSKGLTAMGITNRIFRSPVGLTQRGCSYSVSLAEHNLPAAIGMLQDYRIRPLNVLVRSANGEYTEVAWE